MSALNNVAGSRQSSFDDQFEGLSSLEVSIRRSEKKCENLQMMIDISAKTLRSLRQSLKSNPSTQASQALRETETNLIKMFSQQIISKLSIPSSHRCRLSKYPDTEQWLQVVGLPDSIIKGLIRDDYVLDKLLQISPDELNVIMKSIGADQKQTDTLNTALGKLKAWTESQKDGNTKTSTSGGTDLHWTESIEPTTLSSCSSSAIASRRSKLHNNSTSSVPDHSHSLTYNQRSIGTSRSMRSSGSSSPVPPSPSTHYNTLPRTLNYSPQTTQLQSPLNVGSSYIVRKPQPHTLVNPETLSSHSDHPPSTPHSPLIYPHSLNTPQSPGTPPIGKGKSRPNTPPPARRNVVNQSPTAFDFSRLGSQSETHTPFRSLSQDSHLSGSTLLRPAHSRQSSGNEDENMSTISSRSDSSSSWKRQHTGPSLGHRIEHRFSTRHLKLGKCDYCKKTLRVSVRICKYCRYKCHKECEKSISRYSCGLSNEMIELASRYISDRSNVQSSPLPGIRSRQNINQTPPPDTNTHAILTRVTQNSAHSLAQSAVYNQTVHASSTHDSNSSVSSYTSSNLSSPNLGAFGSAQASPAGLEHFSFPHPSSGSSLSAPISPNRTNPRDENKTSQRHVSYGSVSGREALLTNTTSTIESEDTVVDSPHIQQKSAYSNNKTSDQTVLDSSSSGQTIADSDKTDRDHAAMLRQPSLSKALEEWDIPYEELIFEEQLGTGHVGTVHKGRWHGPVAIKKIPIDPDSDLDAQLIAFKQEIATLKKTRHDNIVLFMGACMKPPELAIVTSFVNGTTLYSESRKLKSGLKGQLNKIINIALQTAQGMGYLHSKDIIHKQLTSKNIFLERSEKVIITDFGLSHVSRLNKASRSGLTIQKGWLNYLSPEIIKLLHVISGHPAILPYNKSSDMFAFGTIWYELLTGTWPYSSTCEPELIIWLIANSIKPSLHNLSYNKECKELLLNCWMYEADNRPSFTELIQQLEKLPKRRMMGRTISQPMGHLSRSIDSFF